jgi:hypothetical protein
MSSCIESKECYAPAPDTPVFEVVVSGSVLYDTDDEVMAGAIADNYRTIGWKNVSVIRR